MFNKENLHNEQSTGVLHGLVLLQDTATSLLVRQALPVSNRQWSTHHARHPMSGKQALTTGLDRVYAVVLDGGACLQSATSNGDH